MVVTRSSVWPAFSRATIVFSNFGADVTRAMFSISFRFSAIAVSSAGLNRATWTLSNGGTPPYGPSHSESSGFGSATLASPIALTVRFSELSATIKNVREPAKSSARLRVMNLHITKHLPLFELLKRHLDAERLINSLVYLETGIVVQRGTGVGFASKELRPNLRRVAAPDIFAA